MSDRVRVRGGVPFLPESRTTGTRKLYEDNEQESNLQQQRKHGYQQNKRFVSTGTFNNNWRYHIWIPEKVYCLRFSIPSFKRTLCN